MLNDSKIVEQTDEIDFTILRQKTIWQIRKQLDEIEMTFLWD